MFVSLSTEVVKQNGRNEVDGEIERQDLMGLTRCVAASGKMLVEETDRKCKLDVHSFLIRHAHTVYIL